MMIWNSVLFAISFSFTFIFAFHHVETGIHKLQNTLESCGRKYHQTESNRTEPNRTSHWYRATMDGSSSRRGFVKLIPYTPTFHLNPPQPLTRRRITEDSNTIHARLTPKLFGEIPVLPISRTVDGHGLSRRRFGSVSRFEYFFFNAHGRIVLVVLCCLPCINWRRGDAMRCDGDGMQLETATRSFRAVKRQALLPSNIQHAYESKDRKMAPIKN